MMNFTSNKDLLAATQPDTIPNWVEPLSYLATRGRIIASHTLLNASTPDLA
jgi:hypothetical protein